MKVAFLDVIQKKARDYANSDNSIPIQSHHMMAAIIDNAASAFIFNASMSEEMNNVKADIEALRRSVRNYSDEKSDEKDLKLLH